MQQNLLGIDTRLLVREASDHRESHGTRISAISNFFNFMVKKKKIRKLFTWGFC